MNLWQNNEKTQTETLYIYIPKVYISRLYKQRLKQAEQTCKAKLFSR